MPAKRRYEKDRLDPQRECKLFDCIFNCGEDFGDDLEVIGLVQPSGRIQNAAELDAEYTIDFMEASLSAWRRIGRLWLDTHWSQEKFPTEYHKLWAVIMFGDPEENENVR